jgi:hypothetical protein
MLCHTPAVSTRTVNGGSTTPRAAASIAPCTHATCSDTRTPAITRIVRYHLEHARQRNVAVRTHRTHQPAPELERPDEGTFSTALLDKL